MKIFIFGFLQVFLVSAQTYFISRSYWLGVAIGGFLISFVWTFNVKAIAFGTPLDMVIYSTGAMLGALAGLWVGKTVLKRRQK